MSAVEGCWFASKAGALQWLDERGYVFHENTMAGTKRGNPDAGFCTLDCRKIGDTYMWRAEITEASQ